MRSFLPHGRRLLSLAGATTAFALVACTDSTAPTAAPAPISPPARPSAYIWKDTRSFQAGPDTTILVSWGSSGTTCNNEIRATGVDGSGAGVVYRGVYLTGGSCGTSENQPLIEFRPHEDTRENLSIELYDKNWVGIMYRGLSKSWFYYQNNLGQQDNLDFPAWLTLRWTPVSYPVASRTISPSSVTMDAGTTLTLVSHASAPNGVEIYNQPTTSWSSANGGIASLGSASGTQTASSFGAPWYNWTNTVSGQTPGNTNVSVVFGGQSISVPVSVTPAATLTGGSWLPSGSSASYSIQASYCGSGCTIHWDRWFSSTNETWDLGTFSGSSSTITIWWTGKGESDLRAYVTANGATKILTRNITEQVDPSGGGCDPSQIFC